MSNITPETIAALKATKSPEELAAVCQEKTISPKDIFAYAKESAKTPEELVAFAKGIGIAIAAEQAERFLNPYQGELADEELANVAGGGCDQCTACPGPLISGICSRCIK
jgi:lysozyme family protein